MKILWLVNIMLPEVSEHYGEQKFNICGWLVKTSKEISKNDELIICYPDRIKRHTKINNIKYYGISDSKKNKDWLTISKELYDIVNIETPDIIHVWGTEKVQSYAMLMAVKDTNFIDKTVISIQGLISIYQYHYMAGLPWNAQLTFTWRDIVRKDTIILEKLEMASRGEFEKKAIKLAKHSIGRTSWDYICAKLINPSIKYHFNNETLRDSFYKHEWNLQNCVRHSIFISQAQYPIKGFHFVLEAVYFLKEKYPNIKVFVAGSRNPFTIDFKPMGYTAYLTKKAKKLGVYDLVKYVGNLTEQEMCEQMLRAHVFVSASAIENSPNSVGEAMLLGVPIVASNVGGTKDMLRDEIEGFLYQYDAPYMLAGYIDKIFSNDSLAEFLSNNSKKHAKITHDPEKNYKELIDIYNKINNY